LQVLRTLSDESVDAVVSDPPYGLSFMGKRWDYDVPSVEIWQQVLRVLKPGGHLLAFAGTRTQHRMAVRIEDAGFEIRDMIAWVYGSGFPKSLDVSKAIDKAAGAEREVVRTPITPKSTAGKGLSNELDERPWMTKAREQGYHEHAGNTPATEAAKQWQGWGTSLKPSFEPVTVARKPLTGTVAENVLQHGTGGLNVDGCRVGCSGEALRGGGVGTRSDGWDRPWKADAAAVAAHKAKCDANADRASTLGRWPANLIHDGSDEVVGLFPDDGEASAARFFYCAKASKRDRGESNRHPTVKPTALMRYLCRLITPPGGLVLDPFTGSGSTGRGAVLEGFRFIGMELDAEHVEEAKRRILEVQNGWTDEPEDEPAEDLPGQRLLF
jgi:site-specific DNA-methyltransferase (adenine-specific)